jgi:hypothetical protein
MTGAHRTAWTILAVLGGTALLLRATDALPGLISDVPRGMHVCATLAEAEARTGLRLHGLETALGDAYTIKGRIATVAKPAPAVSVTLRPASAGQDEVTYFRTTSTEIPSLLRSPLSAFHTIEVELGAGRTASLRAATTGDGSVWQDLEWGESRGRTALRTRGRTVDLLRFARRLIKDGP